MTLSTELVPFADEELLMRVRKLLPNVCQIMDAWASGDPEYWTEWDQEQRNEATAIMRAIDAQKPTCAATTLRKSEEGGV